MQEYEDPFDAEKLMKIIDNHNWQDILDSSEGYAP